MFRSDSQNKVRMSTLLLFLAVWCSVCSWVTDAFHTSSYRSLILSRQSIQRSLSGLLSPSIGRGAVNMVAVQNEESSRGIWGIPSWIAGMFAAPSSNASNRGKRVEGDQKAHIFLRRRVNAPTNSKSGASSPASNHSPMSTKDVQIPGFMDFDPKYAAKTAHYSKSFSAGRGDNTWFHL